jgi:ankyrin repeat protein
LKALRAGDAGARVRLLRAWPQAPADAGLRDVQFALAREHGVDGWRALTDAITTARRSASPHDQALHALLSAAADGNTEAVAAALDAHPELIDERGVLEGHTGLRTALHFGVQHASIVRLLLERGADPNIRDEGDNAFPLHFAAERGDLEVVKLLVEHGAQTSAGEVDDHQLDIIGWATCFPATRINEDVVRYLLAHGARHTLFSAVATGDVDALRDRVRERPSDLERPMDSVNRRRHALHLAAVKRQPAALAALLDAGADPNAVDVSGVTALDEAALSGQQEMVQRLLAAGATLTLPSAIALRRTDDIERLLSDDPNALKPGGTWGTLIVRAAAESSAGVIEMLIRHGASANVHDDPVTSVDGTHAYTPLHAAAFNGNLAAIEVLLRHGANPRVRDSKYGGTPAGWASYAGKREAFERLMKEDLDIFDAIDFDQPDRIPQILRNDPAALLRPFGEYLPADARPGDWCPEPATRPLAWASAQQKTDAVRALVAHGAELTTGGHLARTHQERVAAFLRMACLDWAVGGSDRSYHAHAAARLLDRFPELARANIYTAVACGEVDEVERLLDANPAVAQERGGPRQWTPLLYLCTARFPSPGAWSDNAAAIARLLLERGADPNAYYLGGNAEIHYTALTSVAGRGEEQAPVHPRARELAALLLERGAEPYDQQVFYNVFAGHASFGLLDDDDFVWLLELLYQEAVRRGHANDWREGTWRMLDMGGYGGGAWYLLHRALDGNYLRIAEWALSHGANPNPPRATDERTPEGTLYEQAIRRGRWEFAELLARYGAERTTPSVAAEDEFAAACFRLDRDRAAALSAADPKRLRDPSVLFNAAEQDRVEVAELLLDLGVSPDVADARNTRALHVAAYHGAPRVAALLVARGAEVDVVDQMHGTTPIYWAHFGQRDRLVDLLTPYTRDVWTLVPRGKVDRLRIVLADHPQLALSRYSGGSPLFFLPDDEGAAAEIVELFLSHGADPCVRRADGTTAAQIARARGLTAAADLLACD